MSGAPRTADAVVVGAGITGLATALALAERGARVQVLERYQPAAMASGWTLAGVRQSGRHPAELDLARQAVALWTTLDERLDASTGYRQSGNLRLARDDEEVRTIRALVADQNKAGLDLQWLDGIDARERVPGLSSAVAGASWCGSDGHADPLATAAAFRAAAERCGVHFRTATAAQRIVVRAGRFRSVDTGERMISADHCVLATGIQTNDLLIPLEQPLPIRLARVAVLQSAVVAPLLLPVIGVANADLALRQQLDGRLRMTSGAEYHDTGWLERDGTPVVPPGELTLAATLQRIAHVLPTAAAAAITRTWGGLLDMTPDALPVIDHVPGIEGLVVAAGFSGHGFGIGPAVGEALASLTLGDGRNLTLSPFAFSRFADTTVDAQPALHG